MAIPSCATSADHGRRLLRAIKQRYYMSCYNKLAHQHSVTAIEHANDISQKHPERIFSIYVCEFCTCLHVGRGNKMLLEDEIYDC